jgi:regulator of RNase E activity RraA
MSESLTFEQLEELRRLDTCAVANAIETFELRLRNEGFADSSVRCMFPDLTPMIGYAATVKIRASNPPPDGHNYLDRTDWWNYILATPAPRIVVVEDLDQRPGRGAFLGEVHVNILRALGCTGAVTNGAVRDLPAVESTGFHFFAGGASVSHAYVHIVEIGAPVEIGGLKVLSGDLLHGDRHGVLSVPIEIARDVPAAATKLFEKERMLIALCRSTGFTLDKLRAAVKRPA